MEVPVMIRAIYFLAALFALLAIPAARALAVENPLSAFVIMVDGKFTDGLTSGGALQGEWSDITPLAFISPATNSGPRLGVALGDPRTNSLLYAAVAPGAIVVNPGHELYLMYDYLPRTNPAFAPGEFIADVDFPIQPFPSASCPQCNGTTRFDATVQFRGAAPSAANNFQNFDVFVSAPAISASVFPAADFDMDGAIGFGPSTLSNENHLLVELEVGLNTPQNFFGPGSPKDFGVYSPDPAFWTSGISNNLVDPWASSAMIEIHPLGGTSIFSTADFSPEPSTFCLCAIGVAGAWMCRRHATRNG
jgi:hypothetical protein